MKKPRLRHYLRPEVETEIKQAYESGEPIQEIMTRYRIGIWTLYTAIHGIKRQPTVYQKAKERQERRNLVSS